MAGTACARRPVINLRRAGQRRHSVEQPRRADAPWAGDGAL